MSAKPLRDASGEEPPLLRAVGGWQALPTIDAELDRRDWDGPPRRAGTSASRWACPGPGHGRAA